MNVFPSPAGRGSTIGPLPPCVPNFFLASDVKIVDPSWGSSLPHPESTIDEWAKNKDSLLKTSMHCESKRCALEVRTQKQLQVDALLWSIDFAFAEF